MAVSVGNCAYKSLATTADDIFPGQTRQFQLKATPISPAEAAGDVLTSAKTVKPMIRTALEAGGTYVMLCARSYTKKQIANIRIGPPINAIGRWRMKARIFGSKNK